MSNPKPCPFCGHAGEAAVNSDAVRCRWHVGWQPRVDWNARPIEDRLQLQLDAIRGLATGQPGSDPSSSDQGWSPALCAVRAVLRERDEARDEAERLAKKGDVYREAWHVIESALDGAGGLSPKHSPEEARDFIVRVIREREVPDIPQCEALIARVERLEAALVEFAEAARCYYDSGERQSRYYDAENTVLALGREIAGRKP